MSELWSGRATYKFITKHCGLIELLDEGDNVMADRGFDIQEIMAHKKVTVNIPPTLDRERRTQFSLQDVAETRKIASVRIYVECPIGRIKNFHILDGTLPITLVPVAPAIVHTCGYLTNFWPSFVKQH